MFRHRCCVHEFVGQGGRRGFVHVHASGSQVNFQRLFPNVNRLEHYDTKPFLGASVAEAVPMIHAVLPNTFQASGIKNVTIIQDNLLTEALLCDSFTYYLHT